MLCTFEIQWKDFRTNALETLWTYQNRLEQISTIGLEDLYNGNEFDTIMKNVLRFETTGDTVGRFAIINDDIEIYGIIQGDLELMAMIFKHCYLGDIQLHSMGGVLLFYVQNI